MGWLDALRRLLEEPTCQYRSLHIRASGSSLEVLKMCTALLLDLSFSNCPKHGSQPGSLKNVRRYAQTGNPDWKL